MPRRCMSSVIHRSDSHQHAPAVSTHDVPSCPIGPRWQHVTRSGRHQHTLVTHRVSMRSACIAAIHQMKQRVVATTLVHPHEHVLNRTLHYLHDTVHRLRSTCLDNDNAELCCSYASVEKNTFVEKSGSDEYLYLPDQAAT